MNIQKIQEQIDHILGVSTNLIRRKKTAEDERKELFINTMTQIELALNRSQIASNELKIDLSNYDELYYQIIDNLIYMKYGKKAGEIISYYLYDIEDRDNESVVVNDNGSSYDINNLNELWDVIKNLEDDAQT